MQRGKNKSNSSSASVCLLEPGSRSIVRKQTLLRIVRVNSNFVSEKKQEEMCDHIDRKVSM